MKPTLKRGLILAGCMALLCPSAVAAQTITVGEGTAVSTQTPNTTTDTTSAYAPINRDTDLTGALPTEVVSINQNSKPNNVIFNCNGLTITLYDYYVRGGSVYMYVSMNNNTSTTYYIDSVDGMINGAECTSLAYMTAPAGQTTTDYIVMYGGSGLSSSELARYTGGSSISDIQFRLEITNLDTYNGYYGSEAYYNDYYSDASSFYDEIITPPIQFKDHSVDTSSLATGTVLYNGNGLKIVKKDMLIRNYGPADLHLILYIENTSSETIYIENEGNILNNYAVAADLEGSLSPGQNGIVQIVIPESELKTMNITRLSNIRSFQGSFAIYTGEAAESASYYSGYYGSSSDSNKVKTPLINFLR